MSLGPARDPRLPRPRQPFGLRRPSFSTREEVRQQVEIQGRQPYGYESNRQTLAWLSGTLAVWVVLALITAWHDNNIAEMLETWQAKGFVTVPREYASVPELVQFAQVNGVACRPEDIVSQECDLVFGFAGDVNRAAQTSSFILVPQLVVFIVLLTLLGSFIHRASRNIRPLKSEGQQFTPNWSVGWLFVPVANLYQPMQVFGEIWRASDPKAPTDDPTKWRQGARSPLVSFWWLTVVAAMLFSPRILTWILASNAIDDRITAQGVLVWSDILMVLPAIVGLILFRAIYARQEARFQIVGPNQVLPITAQEIAEARRQKRKAMTRR